MGFRLPCECGRRLPISEGAAGGAVQCSCGRTVMAPSLGELRRQFSVEDEVEATLPRKLPAVSVAIGLVGAIVFGALFLVACGVVVAVGSVTLAGFFVFAFGTFWLLILIFQECQSKSIVFDRLFSFTWISFVWQFAFRRWDIAKWAFFCHLAGFLLILLGLYIGS